MSVPDRATRRPATPAASRRDGPPLAGPGDPSGSSAESPALAAGEELLFVLRGIGAVLYLTTERVIVARDGGERRPRTGVLALAIDEISHVRIEPGTGPSGRIAISTNGLEVVSMFFDARSADRAREAIDVFRPLVARRRRGLRRLDGRPPE